MIRSIFEYIQLIKSGMFDKKFYLLNYKDVLRADIEPLWHFVRYGWKENRNPSRDFDTNFYLKNNNDVFTKKINPLLHYYRYGNREGRKTKK